MLLQIDSYTAQVTRWPPRGNYILAQYEEDAIVVYQAYRPSIGLFAAEHGYFGGEFRLSRMSWIKTNFLWMMHRSAWGTRSGQEVVLAIWLRRTAFDEILRRAVHTTFVPRVYENVAAWRDALANSPIRLQWDPDHDPSGRPLPRKAIQLGLSGDALASYARDWIVRIEDISSFVHQQHHHVRSREYDRLQTALEFIYHVSDPDIAGRLGLTPEKGGQEW